MLNRVLPQLEFFQPSRKRLLPVSLVFAVALVQPARLLLSQAEDVGQNASSTQSLAQTAVQTKSQPASLVGSQPSAATGGEDRSKGEAENRAKADADNAAPTKPSSSSSKLSTTAQLQAIPALTGTGVDVANRSKAILAHLSAVLRFYRETHSPTQKVGEVSDVLYQEQAETNAKSVAQLAFQFAQNLGILLTKVGGKTAAQPSLAGAGASGTEAQRLQVARDNATAQIADLQAQNIALAKQIASARKNTVAALQEQQEQVQGRLELQKALSDALGKLSSSTETQTSSGLLGDIARLQHSAPELIDTKAKPIAPPILENLSSARDAGISTQATVIFQLLSTRHDLEQRMRDVDVLRTQATDMRTPIIKILKTTIQEGQSLQNAPPPDGSNPAPPTDGTTPAPSPVDTRKRYDQLTATFSALATATLPLSEEVLLLDQSTSNLAAWHSAVDVEYNIILRSLLIRVLEIAVALGILFLISELWRRATTKYILDVRRRRQLLLIRRIVIGFFTGCVLIFGFVTQFNSLATFAGFITAGIAVGLQTILLSVAAYFFIVGRFGVRVGDRITVAGVTGDVIEVGLVRFYLIELTGTGTELHSTGRVAVFANSVLFQAGTPLYKQLPGTEYAWHELTVKLNQTANYQLAVDAVTKVVNDVYATYKARIDQQHRQVETWMDNAIEAPQIESRMQLTDGGLQFALLFPVEIKDAADVDSNITEQLVSAMNTNEEVRNAIAATPLIKASIKA